MCQVLILVPFRGAALRVVQALISLLEAKGKKIVVNNKKRFKEEFGEEADDKPSNLQRPDDYSAIFSGNVDDHFRIGTVQQTQVNPLLDKLLNSVRGLDAVLSPHQVSPS